VNPRSEPLLWLQLIALGVFPLEVLLLLLLLAGNDPGPLPGLERVLCWAIGALAPTLLLWRQPADPCSLLLAQVPLRGRRPLQRQLASQPPSLGGQLGLALGTALLLPLLWWLDSHAALAAPLAPFPDSPRLVALLLGTPLLALMVWQGQQVLQALGWLLRGNAALTTAPTPSTSSSAGPLTDQRLSLGLPLLLLPAFSAEAASPGQPSTSQPSAAGSGGAVAVTVEPKQAPEQAEGPQLDQQVD
jgi:hypothetical protein